MIYKLIYTRKILKICRKVDTDTCERCNTHVEDFKHLLWECRYSRDIWTEVEKQINERYNIILDLKYHTMLLGINEKTNKNHKAINTIIMTVKKRICYMERLKCSLPNNIKSLIDIRINTEKYIEKKQKKTTSKWDIII